MLVQTAANSVKQDNDSKHAISKPVIYEILNGAGKVGEAARRCRISATQRVSLLSPHPTTFIP